jgi:predicted transcriptional regulator
MSPGQDRERVLEIVEKRRCVLGRLVDGPVSKPELVASLDVSRSTVDRAIRDLESQSLVTREDGTFAATLAGRLAWRAFRRFRRRVDDVIDARELLAHLDPDCGLDTAVIDGAAVHVAEGPAPYRPTEELDRLIEAAERIRSLTTSITDSSVVELVRETIVERGVEYEGVFTADVARFLREECDEAVREMAETGRFRAYCTPSLPFGLFLFDLPERRVAAVVVYGDVTELRGVVVSDSAPAVEWATRYYRETRRGTEEITGWFCE